MQNENIARVFNTAASVYPNHIAIVEGYDSISYRQLQSEVESTAAYFIKRGIVTGDRVLVFVPMSIDLYRVVLALFTIGAVAVFVDEWVSKERLLLSCKLAKCRGFIGPAKMRMLGLWYKPIRRIPIKLGLSGRSSKQVGIAQLNRDDPALITYTTGSTGSPKAANRTHGFLRFQFDILKEKIATKPSDVEMTMLPIVLLINLGVGATSIIPRFNSRKPQNINPSNIIGQIESHKVNRITASPFFVKSLAEFALEQKISLKTVNQVITGGAPVFPTEAKLYTQAFDASIEIIYGSTEAEPISGINANQLVSSMTLMNGLPVGDIHPSTKLRIINTKIPHQHQLNENEFDQLTLLDGQVGEIVVCGDHVLASYFDNSQALYNNKIKVGATYWHKTGDSGYTLGSKLFLTGRVGQLILLEGGSYLSPFIIESKVEQLAEVTKGTILAHEGRVVLCLESALSRLMLNTLVQDIDYDSLVVLPHIPRDPRHNSKIDYEKLKLIVHKMLS